MSSTITPDEPRGLVLEHGPYRVVGDASRPQTPRPASPTAMPMTPPTPLDDRRRVPVSTGERVGYLARQQGAAYANQREGEKQNG